MISLENRRDERMSQLSNQKSEYVRFQQELLEIENKMKILNQQKERLINQGVDEAKLNNLIDEIQKHEDQGFELLQHLETNELERNDSQTFIEGIGKTISEIREEAKAEISKNEEAIKQLDLRLEGITEILPQEFKDLLMRTLKKNLAHGPFTRIDNGSCLFCRYKISRVDESEIDMQKKLKVCPQCSRIFIPYGT